MCDMGGGGGGGFGGGGGGGGFGGGGGGIDFGSFGGVGGGIGDLGGGGSPNLDVSGGSSTGRYRGRATNQKNAAAIAETIAGIAARKRRGKRRFRRAGGQPLVGINIPSGEGSGGGTGTNIPS